MCPSQGMRLSLDWPWLQEAGWEMASPPQALRDGHREQRPRD